MKPSTMTKEIKNAYEKKRRAAEARRDERVKAVYQRVPRLAELEGEMNRKGIAVSRGMLSDPPQQENLLRELEASLTSLKEQRLSLLKQHGLRESDFLPDWSCALCRDRGVLPSGAHCSCYHQQLINKAYEMSNLSGMLEKENFKTFRLDLFSTAPIPSEGMSQRENMLQVLHECEGFAFNFEKPEERNLLFYGPTGLGKTFMANCIAKSLLDRGKIVIYQTAPKLFDLLGIHHFRKEGWDQDPQMVNRLMTCDLLIVDDLGTELTNAFTASQLFQIINQRHVAGLKTLISTNLNNKDLVNVYDDRIGSRLAAYYNFVKFFGKDVRWEKAQRE